MYLFHFNVSTTAPTDDRTAIPLSDICSIQVSTECSSTEDPGEQEIDEVDVSNASQNPVEDKSCKRKYYMN